MKIERMILSFPDMRHIIVDHEGQLKNYNLERLVGVDVTVTMKPNEFEAFREWKAAREPKKVEVPVEPVKAAPAERDYSY